MKTPRTQRKFRAGTTIVAPILACLATLLAGPVHATIALPETPMQTNYGVPPNIWFILDDSGSMAWRYMYSNTITSLVRNGTTQVSKPTGDNTTVNSTYGSNSTDLAAMYDQNYVTNTMYYNPSNTYRGWQKADGTYMADTSFASVYTSDTLIDNSTGALTGATQTFYVPPTTGALNDATLYTRYTFLTDGTAQKCLWSSTTTSFSVCTTMTSFTWPGGVSRTLAQEKTNFANWYSYHRTRTKLAKAGASYAFNDDSVFNNDNNYRVGFTTIWQRNEYRIPVANNNGIFRDSNRSDWFDRLFNATANNGTPLIPALTRAGDYFKETGTTGPYGPQATAAQYECRQNFTILTTDGYWNSGTTTVGNVDNAAGTAITRPDGAPYTYTPANPYKDNWTNTLADVAMYYWKNDLRTDLPNTVPTSASNPAFWQHMATFAISIGLKGTLDPKTDLAALTAGTKSWPDPTNAEDIERVDDLFHTAVNGHGTFVSAGNPDEFSEGLGNALRSISSRRGTGSNASVAGTSTTAGVKVFIAKYFTAKWYGELQAFPVGSTGVGTSQLWNATVPTWTSRKIFTYNGTAGQAFPTSTQATALTAQVADYIRGDRSQEQQFSVSGTLRSRSSLLGDIINSSPVYVKTSGSVETVYIGTNDGMMHAFDASNGNERFAYVPAALSMSKLKDFSDPDYTHHFYVDGSIVVSSDTDIASRRILAGTLGRGGKGIYALDVTDPVGFDATKVLWEKNGTTDTNLGNIIGSPFIAKLNDGSVALVTANGINSTSNKAMLLIYDLATGALIKTIDTGGTGSADNGLSAPNGWDEDGNGTVDTVYAGDIRGNVWKFDLSDANSNQWGVDNHPLYAPSGSLNQPISGGVTVAFDPYTEKRWVFFGTGRLLSLGDMTDTSRQTWYGVIDDPARNTAVSRADMTARNIAQYDSVNKQRAFEPYSPLPSGSLGWYIDLDLPPDNRLEGERMIGEPQLVKDVLVASSVIPDISNPCNPGRGYVNAVDAFTGTTVRSGFFDANHNGDFSDDKVGGSLLGSYDPGVGLLTDPVFVDGLMIVNGALGPASIRVPQGYFNGRISWREIVRNN